MGRGLQSRLRKLGVSIDEAPWTGLQDLHDEHDTILLVSQRYQWVDLRGAARGNVAREEGRNG